MKVKVRPARIEEMDAIMRVEESAWDEGQRAKREQWEARIQTFNEGTLVATVSDKVVGLLSTEIIQKYDFDLDAMSWPEVTDNGYIRNTHTQDGTYLYGADLSIARGAPASVKTGLLVAAGELAVRRGLKGILLGGRIPGYHRFAHRMSPHDYVFGKRASGHPLDPEIYMYSKYSVKPIKVIPNYFADPKSMDYGVLLFWANPFQAENREAMTFSLTPLLDLFARTVPRFQKTIGAANCLQLDLPGAGCAWAKQTGGCTMCSFSSAASDYSQGKLLPAELFESMYHIARNSARRQRPRFLSVFNGGSFLNPDEIPPTFPGFLAAQVRDDAEIELLYVESRAEYITREHLMRIVPLLGSKKLVLGVGLESVSDHVRNHIIRKGLPLSTYRAAIITAHAAGVGVRTYVLLKPAGLAEGEAVAETVQTVRAAFDMGTDEVSVEAAFVAPGSALQRAFERGTYRPPSLWSVVEVIRATAGLGPVYLGKFTDTPPPVAFPDSCPQCAPTLRARLDQYRATLNAAVLEGLPDCQCRKELHSEVETANQRLSRSVAL